VGAFRAAVRAAVVDGDAARIPKFTGEGVDCLDALFDALTTT
jgi:hypothetical protein